MRGRFCLALICVGFLVLIFPGHSSMPKAGASGTGISYLPLLAYPEEDAPKPIPWLCAPQSAPVSLDMECSQIDAPDNDHQNLAEEFICMRSQGETADLTRWTISDLHPRYHTYRFEAYELEPGAAVKLHTGHGVDSRSDLYWGYHHAIWNNAGDTFCLRDGEGELVQACDYGRLIEEGVSPVIRCEVPQ